MRSPKCFGGFTGSSVSSGVGMPCKNKKEIVNQEVRDIALHLRLTVTKSISEGLQILVRMMAL